MSHVESRGQTLNLAAVSPRCSIVVVTCASHVMAAGPRPKSVAQPKKENKELASLSTLVHYDQSLKDSRRRDGESDDDDHPPSKPRNFSAVRFGSWVLDTW